MSKRTVRLTESDLKTIITETINKVLNEGVNYSEKIQQLIDAANNAYMKAAQIQDGYDYPLMDKKGNSYGLKNEIVLDGRGYVIIPFVDCTNGWGDYSSTEKIRVLKKVNGKLQIIPGDTWDAGWRDVQKMLKRIIRDSQIGIDHFQQYDPSWEDSETQEQFNLNKSNLKNMNKKIGRIANAGMNYLK
jgi:hypothetical protein